jgi:hypothetical protein
MAQAERPSETAVNDLLSVATLLEDPRLARVYTHVSQADGITVLHALRDVIQEIQSIDPYFDEIGTLGRTAQSNKHGRT